jgi:hypothetical protein
VALRKKFSRVRFEENGDRIHAILTPADRAENDGFTSLADRFLGYVRHPKTLPAWEKPNMLAKYYITTKIVQMAREAHP